MIEATTQTITTDICKAEIVVKDWITAKEQQTIQNVIFAKMKMDVSPAAQRDGLPATSGIDPAAAVEMQNKSVETYVVSVNGDEKNKLQNLLSMPDADFQQVIDHVNSLDAKKNSQTTN